MLKNIGSVGAYSHSQGIPHIRESVAKFISERDGYPADPSKIFLTQGASAGVQLTLEMIVSHNKVGVMIPIPQYPLYTATLAVLDANPVPYYLDESKEWGLTVSFFSRYKSFFSRYNFSVSIMINASNLFIYLLWY